jgi:LysM repeat protein
VTMRPTVCLRFALPLAAALGIALRAAAQSAETAPASSGAVADTLHESAAARETRQRWAAPFAVEGTGQPAPREPRAHVTWLRPDTVRRTPPAARPAAHPAAQTTARRPAAAPAPAPARPRTHTVARGETFLGIARRYGLTQDALRTANPGVAWERLRLGITLRIPPAPRTTPPARPAATTAARRTAAAARDTSSDDSTPAPSGRAASRDSSRSAASRDSAAARKPAAARRDSASTRTSRATAGDSAAARRTAAARRDSAQRRASPAPAAGTRRHVVAAGESLFAIARRYGVAAQRIRDVNGLSDDRMRVGQVLVIPPQS